MHPSVSNVVAALRAAGSAADDARALLGTSYAELLRVTAHRPAQVTG